MTEEKQKIKLLIASDCFMPRKDGIARFLSEIMPYLTQDFEVTVLAPNYKGKIQKELSEDIKLIKFPLRKLKIGDFSPSKPRYSRIKSEVKKADIIWTQTLGPIGAMTIWAANSQKKPVVSYIHSFENELFTRSIASKGIQNKTLDKLSKGYIRFFYNRCYQLMVPFEKAADVLKGYGIKTDKKVVHLGVDTDKFVEPKDKRKSKSKVRIPPDKFVIGYCGRIAKEKDLKTLYKAFNYLKEKRKDLFLLIVGDGPESEKEIFKGEDIKITGSVENVVPYLQAMDVFVLPSLTETSSLSTMEAMATGIPVVVTPVGFIKTYVENNYNGYMFQKGDIETLMHRIEEFMDNEKLRLKLGKSARRTITNSYVWGKTARGCIRVLKRVLAETKKK